MKKIALFFLLSLTQFVSSENFPFNPPPNFGLSRDLLYVHHPVSTNNELAQSFFDQGMTLLYAFNHDAAYWSFFRASQVDPNLAMAYWGMAIALGKNINMDVTLVREKKAYEHIQKALSLIQGTTPAEKAYIRALANRYSNDPSPDFNKLSLDYSNAMRKLTESYPDDPDAATLFSESILDLQPWKQWDNDGKPQEGTLEAVDVLESVLKNFPQHLGANHYYIHTVEASPHPEWALMSAERLKNMLPASGHILHMPSHIYLLVGDYNAAVQANRRAVKADLAYIQKYGMTGIYPLHYLSHNYYFLSRAYALEGNYQGAIKTAFDLKNFYAPHFQHMPELEYYEPTPLFVFLRFNENEEILRLPPPSKDMKTSHALWRFGRGVAFANFGNVEEAKREKQAFLDEIKEIPRDSVYGYNKFGPIADIATNYLTAKIEEASGNRAKAIDYLQGAVDVQDTLSYNEPPDWFFPLRESLGGLMLREGRFKEAEKVFREDLSHHPQNGRSLFGLKEALRGQLKFDDYYWVEQNFKRAWAHSDTKLSIDSL